MVGGSGFLGRRGVTWAGSRHIAVDATYLTAAPPEDTNASWHRCDILDVDQLHELMAAVKPTAVINAAYRQRGDRSIDVCSTGAENVASAAAAVAARIVHVSTDLVFDGEIGRPYREDDPQNPINDYGAAKAEAERLVPRANPNSVVVRTSLIYGDVDAPQERLVQRAADEGDISFFTDEWRSPVHVDHLAAAVGKLALDSDTPKILHAAGNERINRLDFAKLLAAARGRDPDSLSGSPADPSLGPRASDVTLDVSAALQLGFELPGPTVVLGGAP